MANNQELPNAFVLVLFDYDYTNSDQGDIISIRVNEIYRLVNKNNEEWWEVLPLNSKNVDDESFFLPCNYVTEISESEVKTRTAKTEKEKKKEKDKEAERDKKSKKEKEKEKEREKEKEKDKKSKDKTKVKEVEKEKEKPAEKPPVKPVEKAPDPPPVKVQADDEADSFRLNDRTGSLKRSVPNLYPNLNSELTRRFSAKTGGGGNVHVQDIDIDSPATGSPQNLSALAYDDSETESFAEESTSAGGAPEPEADLQPLYENLAKLRALAAEKERQRQTAARTALSGRASAENLLSRDRPGSKKIDLSDRPLERSTTDKDKDKEKEKADGDAKKETSSVRRLEISEPTELRALEKRGTLLKTRIFERGKRVSKKKWQDAYVILSGALFMFYRDAKAANPRNGAPFGSPEAILELKYASFEFPASRELTSRKAALLLAFRTAPPSNQIRFGYLLACSDELKMREWSSALQMAKLLVVENKLPKAITQDYTPLITAPIESIQLGGPAGPQPTRAASQKRPSGESPQTSTNKARSAPIDKTGTDNEKRERPGAKPGASSTSVSAAAQIDEAERKRIKDRLRQFFTRRPGIDTLQTRAILRDDLLTFGSRIELICKREQRSVPAFVERCLAYVEQRGLDMDGIYRLSGNQAHIQKLRCQVDQYDNYDLDGWDVHVVTGALKLFFRELKEPLVPVALGNAFRNAASSPEAGGASARRKRFRELLTTLQKDAPCNYATLRTLLVHLHKVVEHASENRMQFANLAIVFGPSLFGSTPSASTANAMSASGTQPDTKDVSIVLWQAEIVQIFLEEFNALFASA